MLDLAMLNPAKFNVDISPSIIESPPKWPLNQLLDFTPSGELEMHAALGMSVEMSLRIAPKSTLRSAQISSDSMRPG